MSQTIDTAPPVLVRTAADVAWLTLNRPDRHNALVPQITEALSDAIASLPEGLATVVLAAAGRSFSTGGDVAAFHRVASVERIALPEARAGMERFLTALGRAAN